MNKGLVGKISFISLLLLAVIVILIFVLPAFAGLQPGVIGPNSVWVNISTADANQTDEFFTCGNVIYLRTNITCNGETVCNESLTATANYTAIGGGWRQGVVISNQSGENGWTIFEFNDTVNCSAITISNVQPTNISVNASTYDGNTTSSWAGPLLVNMSTIASCPPDASQIPPQVPLLNGSFVNVSGCNQTCSGDDHAEYNGTHWNACGPSFGGGTTNFSQVAYNGSFSAVPLVIDIPGKVKINFTTPVNMSDQNKSSAIMQFAMRNMMAGGRIGINESEWNGQGGKPNLNLSARLTIYNFSGRFGIPSTSRPSIARRSTYGDVSEAFSPCLPSICSGITWDGQNLTFDVIGFSEYSVEQGLSVVLSNTTGLNFNSATNISYSNTKNINFSYTPTWNSTVSPQAVVLWGNFSGSWAANVTNSTSLANATLNYINNTVATDGSYTWNIVINDTTGGNDTHTANWTIIVDTVNPVLNETTPANNSYIYGTSSQLFQVGAYDINMNTSNVSLYYKQSTGESYWKVALTCYGSSSPFTCNTTVNLLGLGESVIQFYFEGTDSATNFASNGTSSLPLNTTIDRTPPTYSNEAKSTENNTQYLPGKSYQFNLTWTDVNGVSKVFIENNFTGGPQTNTTVTTSEGSVYYYSFSDLGAGTYVYRWLANDSANNWNTSFPSTTYIVATNATNPVDIYIVNSTGMYKNQNVTITYGTSITANATLVYSNSGNANLYRDGSTVSLATETITLGGKAAGYAYLANVTGNANYTSNTTGATYYLFVNNATPDVRTFIDGAPANKTVTYPTSATIKGNTSSTGVLPTFSLYISNILLGSDSSVESSILMGYGTHNIVYNNTANANWTTASNSTLYLIVDKNNTNPVKLTINNGTAYNDQNVTITYGTSINASCSMVYSDSGTCSLYRNDTSIGTSENITLGVGTYAYLVNTSGNTNYTENTTGATFYLFVNKADPTSSLLLKIDGSSDSTQSRTYPNTTMTNGSTTITGGDDLNYTLLRNGTLIGTDSPTANETIKLGAAAYNYTFNTSGGTNYTAGQKEIILTINKGAVSLNLTLNETNGDVTYTYPQVINATGWKNATDSESTYNITLWRNGTIVDSNTSLNSVTQNILLGNGTYNYTLTFTSTNYSDNSIVNRYAYVNKGTVQPTLSISPSGWTQTYPTTTNVSCSVLSQDNEVTCSLWRNESSVSGTSENILWGAAAYLYKTNTSTTTNYTTNSTGENQTLIISPGTPDVRTFIDDVTSNKTITYETSATIKGNTSSTGVLPTFNLYISNVNLGSGSSVSQPITMGYGTHNVVYNNTANANWTSASNSTLYLIVNQKNANVVLSPANGTITYEDSSSQYCTDSSTLLNCTIYRNGTAITNDTTEYLPAGYWEFKANISDSANYTNWEVYQNVTVNPKNANVQVYPVTQNPFYPVTVTQYCTDNATLINCSIFRNDASISNNTDYSPGVGTYTYKANLTDQVNCTSYEDTETLTVQINQSTSSFMNLTLNGTETNQTYTYPTVVNASAWNDSSVFNGQTITFTLYRNNGTTETQLGTGNVEENILLGNGTYNYTYYTAGNANYSSANKTFWVFILKGPTSITLYLNGTPWTSNQIKEYPNATNISATINVSSQQSLVVLLRNGTPITNPNETLNDLGAWNYTAYYDQTENYSAASPVERILTIQDTTPPTILLYDYINGTFKKAGDSLTLNISVSDNYKLSSIYNCSVYTGGAFADNITNTSAGWCNGTVTVPTGLTDGNNTLKINTTDYQGLVGSNTSYVVAIDNTNPTPAQPSELYPYTASTGVNITWTGLPGSDSGSGLNFYEVLISTDAVTYTSVYNTSDSSIRSFINSSLSNGSKYYWKVRTYDRVNNSNISSAVSTTIDITVPIVTINTPTSGSSYSIGDEVAVNATISDGGSGIDTNPLCTVAIGGTSAGSFYSSSSSYCLGNVTIPSGLPSGSTEFNVTVSDKAGNAGSGNTTISILAGPQSIVITTPANNSYVNGTITIEVSVSSLTNISRVEFFNGSTSISNVTSAPWKTTWNTANAADGAQNLKAIVYDKNGDSLNSSIVVVNVDNTNPTATSITYPTASLNLSGTFNITATGSDGVGISKIEFYDGDPTTGGTLLSDDSTSPYSIVWTTTASNDGSHTIYARVIDKVNKYLDSSGVTFRIDNTVPTASITSITPNVTSGGIIYINGTVSIATSVSDSGSGIKRTELYIDGGNTSTNTSANPTFSLDTTGIDDGPHSLKIITYDYAGNLKESSPVNVSVSNLGPNSIVITTPANNTYVNDTLTIEAAAGENVYRVEFYNDTTTLIASDSSAPWQASWDTTGASDGWHTLTAKAYDNVNNTLSSTVIRVRVDNTNPSASTLTYPTANMNISGSITLQATGTDAQGIAKIEFYDNSTLLGDDSTSPYTYVWTTNSSNDGAHTLKARVIDNTGRSLDSSTVSVTVDNTKPIPSITSPAAGQDVNGSVTVTATITETYLHYVDLYVDGAYAQTNSSPAATTTFSWNTNSVGDGSHTLSVRAYDYAGNYNDSAGVAVDVFNQAPLSVAITSPANNTYATGTITIIASASAVVNISNVEFYNDTTTLIGTDTDGSDGWSTTWNTSGASDGYHTLTAKAYDNVNNVRTSIAITILVDNINPNAPSLYVPSSTGYLTSHAVTWNWTAASDGSGSGIEKYQIQINSSAGIIKDDNTTSTSYTYYLEDGDYSAQVRAIDKVGLASSWSSYQTVTVDTVAPQNLSVSINSGATYTTSTSVTLTLYAEGAYGCRFRNENLAWSAWESYTTSKAWTLSSGDGTKTVYYQCNDTAGNLADIDSDTIILDSTASGTPALISPANETRTNDTTPTFRWDAVTDSTSGVASYNLVYSTSSDFSTGVTTVAGLMNTSYTPASALAVTTWYWKVNATDAAGNLGSYSQFFTFTIDTTPPIVIAVGPTGTLYTSSATLNATTDESAICKYSASNVAYDSMGDAMTHVGGNVHQASLTGLASGSYTYYFRCKDTAGNENTTTVYTTFSVDVQAPVITSSSPSGFQNISAPNITIYTATSATCKYDTSDKNFSQLSTQFSTTGSTMHTTNTSSSVQEGLNIYYVRCADDASGTNAMQNSLLVMFTRDTSSPYISISVPNATYINSQLVTFTISDSTSMVNISTISVTLAGAGISSFTTSTCTENGQGGYYCSYSDSGIIAGTTGLTVAVTDRAVNTRTSTAAFTYDTSAPIITVTNPSSGALLNTKNVTLAMTTDESATCRYSTSDTSYSLMGSIMNGAGSTSHSMLITAVEGSNAYYFRCQDTAGNVNTTSASITFTIDSIAPFITSFSPSLNTAVTSSTTNITVVTSESATCRYNDTNSTSYAQMASMSDLSTTHTKQLTGLLDKEYSYAIVCNDTAGNLGDVFMLTFKVDTRSLYNVTRPDIPYGYWNANQWNSFLLPQIVLQNTTLATTADTYNVTNVLASVAGNYTIIYYNPNETSTTWTSYTPGVGGTLNTFNDQTGYRPYWIYINVTNERLEIN